VSGVACRVGAEEANLETHSTCHDPRPDRLPGGKEAKGPDRGPSENPEKLPSGSRSSGDQLADREGPVGSTAPGRDPLPAGFQPKSHGTLRTARSARSVASRSPCTWPDSTRRNALVVSHETSPRPSLPTRLAGHPRRPRDRPGGARSEPGIGTRCLRSRGPFIGQGEPCPTGRPKSAGARMASFPPKNGFVPATTPITLEFEPQQPRTTAVGRHRGIPIQF
jgi:hypothetical protein